MKSLSRPAETSLFVVLMAMMVLTRFHHFGDVLHLPDASMALYFLGGLYLRKHWQFVTMLLLALVIDWVAIRLAGVSDFCVTAAYAALPVAYGALWYAGRGFSSRMRGTTRSLFDAWLVGCVAAVASFIVSNGSFYWLGGRYADPNWSEYVARAWQWGPMFVRTTACYLAAAMVLHHLVVRLGTHRRTPALGA